MKKPLAAVCAALLAGGCSYVEPAFDDVKTFVSSVASEITAAGKEPDLRPAVAEDDTAQKRAVVLRPLRGIPEPAASRFAKHLERAGEEAGFVVLDEPGERQGVWSLGSAASVAESPAGLHVAAVFDLVDGGSKRVARSDAAALIPSARTGGWNGVTDEAFGALARAGFTGLAAALGARTDDPQAKPVAAAKRRSEPQISVGMAPGDGAAALERALMDALSDKTDEALTIAGAVAIEKAGPSDAGVTIAWEVAGHDDLPLGKVVQKNTVPQSAIAGAWGALADDAALGAAEAILMLLAEPQSGRG